MKNVNKELIVALDAKIEELEKTKSELEVKLVTLATEGTQRDVNACVKNIKELNEEINYFEEIKTKLGGKK